MEKLVSRRGAGWRAGSALAIPITGATGFPSTGANGFLYEIIGRQYRVGLRSSL